jgi:spermidine/putrescine transport system permease protein
MATEATPARPGRVRAVRHPRALALGRALLNQSLNLYAALALIYLMVPIAIIILFSFNDPQSRFNFVWHGFTLENWKDPFGVPGLGEAMVNSLEIAALSTIVATILGTMMALALVRYQFRGRGLTNLFIFIPLATPEVVLGASLLSLFLTVHINVFNVEVFETGFRTILIAHIMFNISFVVVTVRSRLIGFDRNLEEAAQDLGANGIQTFLRVTLPLIAPGVLAAALLAFALSVDDFVITNFNAGSTVTFPLFVWGAARVATPPQINIIATMIFFVTLALMLLTVLQQRRAERMSAVRPEAAEV